MNKNDNYDGVVGENTRYSKFWTVHYPIKPPNPKNTNANALAQMRLMDAAVGLLLALKLAALVVALAALVAQWHQYTRAST